MNRVMLSITRSPALGVLTRTMQSSAYRQNLWPLRSNSLSSSSRTMFAKSGESGPPCGVPSSRLWQTPSFISPALRNERTSRRTRLSPMSLVGLDAPPRPREVAQIGDLPHEVFPAHGFVFPLHGRLRTLSKRISAFHFAAFRRQVAAEVKGHLPLRFRSPWLLVDSALRGRGPLLWLLLTSPRPHSAVTDGLGPFGQTGRSPGIRHTSFVRRDADLPPCYG